MKKYFIVMAVLALLFAGCKPTEEESDGNVYTKISFKKTELSLGVGDSEKLIIRWEPVSITVAPECTFESSNEEIVTVNERGVVTAVAVGEANITAKCGKLTTVCQVNVKSIQDLLEWGGWKIQSYDSETPLCDPVDVELDDGIYTCVMYPATAIVWDKNITPVYEGQYNMKGLSGAGYVLEVMNMPIYVIAEGDYEGYCVRSFSLTIVDPEVFNPHDTAFAYCAAAGKLGDAAKWYDILTNEESNYSYEEAFTGAALSYFDFDNNDQYYWYGLGGTGIYAGNEAEIYYTSNVTWFANRYGLLLDETGENFVQPAQWAPTIEKHYENLPQQNASKKLLSPRKIVNHGQPLIDKSKMTLNENVLIRK